MDQRGLEYFAKRFALASWGTARTELWAGAAILLLGLLVVGAAAIGGGQATFLSAILLIAMAAWSFQRAGYILLLEERARDRPERADYTDTPSR